MKKNILIISIYYPPIQSIASNIKLLGWVDMDKEFLNCVCYLRNAKHDGLAFSVLEALGYGKVVFYNYNFPYTIYFKNSNDLVERISMQKKLFDNTKISINAEAIKFIEDEFNENKVLSNLISYFRQKGKLV